MLFRSFLIKITGSLAPTQGSLIQAEGLTYVYLDQEYSIIRNDLSVLEQLALFNSELYDNELRTILNRFLFPVSTWNKKCIIRKSKCSRVSKRKVHFTKRSV